MAALRSIAFLTFFIVTTSALKYAIEVWPPHNIVAETKGLAVLLDECESTCRALTIPLDEVTLGGKRLSDLTRRLKTFVAKESATSLIWVSDQRVAWIMDRVSTMLFKGSASESDLKNAVEWETRDHVLNLDQMMRDDGIDQLTDDERAILDELSVRLIDETRRVTKIFLDLLLLQQSSRPEKLAQLSGYFGRTLASLHEDVHVRMMLPAGNTTLISYSGWKLHLQLCHPHCSSASSLGTLYQVFHAGEVHNTTTYRYSDDLPKTAIFRSTLGQLGTVNINNCTTGTERGLLYCTSMTPISETECHPLTLAGCTFKEMSLSSRSAARLIPLDRHVFVAANADSAQLVCHGELTRNILRSQPLSLHSVPNGCRLVVDGRFARPTANLTIGDEDSFQDVVHVQMLNHQLNAPPPTARHLAAEHQQGSALGHAPLVILLASLCAILALTLLAVILACRWKLKRIRQEVDSTHDTTCTTTI